MHQSGGGRSPGVEWEPTNIVVQRRHKPSHPTRTRDLRHLRIPLYYQTSDSINESQSFTTITERLQKDTDRDPKFQCTILPLVDPSFFERRVPLQSQSVTSETLGMNGPIFLSISFSTDDYLGTGVKVS